LKLLIKTYNAWIVYCEKRDASCLLRAMVRAYEECKNLAESSEWQGTEHSKATKAELMKLIRSAKPTEDMNF
jgi:hypothetical protein